MKYIISGGGTGGHIFPAISIANAIKARDKNAEILFVGAEGRMEMERVPQAGYPIEGLPVRGFDRKNLLKNIKVLIDLQKSSRKAKKIIQQFQPDIAIGVGVLSGPNSRFIPAFLAVFNRFIPMASAEKRDIIGFLHITSFTLHFSQSIHLPAKNTVANVYPKLKAALSKSSKSTKDSL